MQTQPIEQADEFVLRNDPLRKPPAAIENNDHTKQTQLFSGLDCLAGQQDLFDAGDLR